MAKHVSTERRVPRQRRSQETAKRIRRATLRLIRDRGAQDFTTNHIAQEADVSISSLYHLYADKEAVLRALYVEWLEAVLADMDRYAEDALTTRLWLAFFAGLAETGNVSWVSRKAARNMLSLVAAYPDLADLSRGYTDAVVDRIAGYLQHYGSPLSKRDRQAAAYLLNEIHEASVRKTWGRTHEASASTHAFAQAAMNAILQGCGLEA